MTLKKSILIVFKRRGHVTQGHTGKHHHGSGGRVGRGEYNPEPLLWFPREGTREAGEVSRSELHVGEFT